MKKESILINASRGAIIDQEALFHALSEKKIAAAGLDVLIDEPPNATHCGENILALSNVCLTPHVAWYSEESINDLRNRIASDIVRVLQGRRPEGFVNQNVNARIVLR
jgi:D-3-phosphoglycerate dehydrogenase